MKTLPALPLPEAVAAILQNTPELSKAYLVGGCVRDWLLGLPVTDYDIEVFEIGFPELQRALSRWGQARRVGRSFGTVKLRLGGELTLDFSLPKRAFSAGGLSPEQARYDPSLSPREAALRRDFTINALLYDPRQQQLLDWVGGLRDLQHSVLRHTSDAFVQDPLRVLRGMRLAARFTLRAAPQTLALCRRMLGEYGRIAAARIWAEWHKWATQGALPSAGLRFLVQSGWSRHFPEIHGLISTPQDAQWHPEGDVLTHTGHCCDAMVALAGWRAAPPQARAVYSLAILAHDFGKPETTHYANRGGRLHIVSPGHARIGALRAEDFLRRIHAPRAIIERVKPLVKHHVAHRQVLTDGALRRLAKRLAPETIESLTLVMTADHLGRTGQRAAVPETVQALARRAAALHVARAPSPPLLKGHHLLQLDMPPGPHLGAVLRAAYLAQLDGCFDSLEGALQWARDFLRSAPREAHRHGAGEGAAPD